MIRAEIIANQSVQDNIVDSIELSVPGIRYTILPLVYGRGRKDRKLGTTTWPETNFMIISYIDENKSEPFCRAVFDVKRQFPCEGIKLFLSDAREETW